MFGDEIKIRIKQHSYPYSKFCPSCKFKANTEVCMNCETRKLNDNIEPTLYEKEDL